MKIFKKTLTGCWFGFGVALTVVLVLFHLHVPLNRSDILGIAVSLSVGTIVGTYCGRVWGVVIIKLGAKKTRDIVRAMGYGMLIGLVTLYASDFIMLIISYAQTGFLSMLHTADYLKIFISIIKIPGLALFGTGMGCILEPLVLVMSGLGGVLLYLLRRQVVAIAEKDL